MSDGESENRNSLSSGNHVDVSTAEYIQRKMKRILTWAVKVKGRLLIVGGIILTFVLVGLIIGLYYALKNDSLIWVAIITLFGSVVTNILAACVVAIFVYLFLFSVPAKEERKAEIEAHIYKASRETAKTIQIPPAMSINLRPLEKRLLSLESTIGQWWKQHICEFQDVCPPELRDLREIIISIQESTNYRVTDVAVLLLAERLKRFVVQLGAVCDGEWRMDFGDINIQTEADLIYNIITESFLKKVPEISIYASTVIHFLNWWLTGPGLSYLEAEKQKSVDRIFLFPPGAVHSVFEDYLQESAILQKAVQQEKDRNWDGQTIFTGDFSQLSKEQAIIILLLNHCIGDNVYVMTPRLCTPSLAAWAQNRTNVDIAIFQKNLSNNLNRFLFCIEINCTATPSEILRSDKSYIYFSPGEINQRINLLKRLIEESRGLKLNLEAIIEESPKLQEIKQKTDNIISSRQKLIDVQDELVRLWQGMKKENDNKKGQRNG